jgi:hypothetical protein
MSAITGSKAMQVFILVILFGISSLFSSVYAADEVIPKQTMAKIKAKAITDFPNNHSMQGVVIKKQTAAYNKLRTYKNKKVPQKILNRIQLNARQYYPINFSHQLFMINQQVNSYLKLGLLTSNLFAAEIVECEDLRWKLTVSGRPATYRGRVKPGTVDVIHVEVRNNRGMIGQNFGFPNPGGAWEIMVWGDYVIRRGNKEKFYCERY